MRVRMKSEASDDGEDTAAAASIILECWSPCKQSPQTSAGKTSSTATVAGAKRKKMTADDDDDVDDDDDDDDDDDVRGGKRRTKRRCYTATADTSRADTSSYAPGSPANDVSGIAEWNGESVLSYFRCTPSLLNRSTQPSLPSGVGKLSTAQSGLRWVCSLV